MVSDVFNMLMYADDTTLYCNINQNILEIEINHEFGKVSQWLSVNKLSLNVGKTKFMVFRMRNKQGWGQVQYLYLVLVLKYIFIST